jgi:TetR/AcrR family transcriptional repressor of nem operon
MMIIMYPVKQEKGEKMMRVTREQVTENRQTILDAAGRLFRERGFDAVTVAEVMNAAGLTHGGFYGYFKSKDDLIAEALAETLTGNRERPSGDFAAYVAAYLSRTHRDDRRHGCATAALAADTARQADDIRSEMTTGLKRQIERLSRIAPGEDSARKRRAAIAGWATMVGAMILARASNDPKLSDEVLDETRAWLDTRTTANPRRDRPGRNADKG